MVMVKSMFYLRKGDYRVEGFGAGLRGFRRIWGSRDEMGSVLGE